MNDEPPTEELALLIPELSSWNEGKGIDVDSWLACVGSHQHAVAYARLFRPAFTVHEDCILFRGFSKESFDGFMRQAGGRKKGVEAVMNHRHLLDLFVPSKTDPSADLLVHLGRLLVETWSCKLRRDFPDRNVVVTFPEDGISDLLDYEITFFQEHPEPTTVEGR